jgi:hypothetical protein
MVTMARDVRFGEPRPRGDAYEFPLQGLETVPDATDWVQLLDGYCRAGALGEVSITAEHAVQVSNSPAERIARLGVAFANENYDHPGNAAWAIRRAFRTLPGEFDESALAVINDRLDEEDREDWSADA